MQSQIWIPDYYIQIFPRKRLSCFLKSFLGEAREIIRIELDFISSDFLHENAFYRECLYSDNLSFGIHQRHRIDSPILSRIISCCLAPNSCQHICSLLKGKIVLPREEAGHQVDHRSLIKHYQSLGRGVLDRNILETHHAGILTRGEQAGEEFLEIAQIMDVNLVTFAAILLPIAGF